MDGIASDPRHGGDHRMAAGRIGWQADDACHVRLVQTIRAGNEYFRTSNRFAQ